MRFAGHLSGLIALSLVLTARADDKPVSPTTPPATNAKDAKKYVEDRKMVGKLDKVTLDSSEAVLEYVSGLGKYARNEKMDLNFADEVKVWFVTPPEKIDENGNSRKMTPAELDKIKSKSGPTKGLYAGAMANLHAGQRVQVILGKPKDDLKRPTSKDKAAVLDKEFEYVTQIVILSDDKPPKKK
jgi:hypothetical protein